jgi:hypothetical protein
MGLLGATGPTPRLSDRRGILRFLPAHLVIDHEIDDVAEWLRRAFGGSSVDALGNTILGSPVRDNPAYRAWPWLGYTVIAYSPTNATLNVSIEPTGEVDLRNACETSWRALVKAAGRRPDLRSAALDDGTSGHTLARATTGFRAHVGRPENLIVLITAAATIIWLLVALAFFKAPVDVVLGAIPAVLAGLVVVGSATVYAERKKLVWT